MIKLKLSETFLHFENLPIIFSKMSYLWYNQCMKLSEWVTDVNEIPYFSASTF